MQSLPVLRVRHYRHSPLTDDGAVAVAVNFAVRRMTWSSLRTPDDGLVAMWTTWTTPASFANTTTMMKTTIAKKTTTTMCSAKMTTPVLNNNINSMYNNNFN